MKKYFLFFFSLLSLSFSIKAQDYSAYQKKLFTRGTDSLPYRLLLPANYNAAKKYPLIIFLHGSGEKGTDNEKQLVHGADLFLRDSIRQKYPAIILFPQCIESSSWSNVNTWIDTNGKEQNIFQTGGKPTVPLDLLQRLIKKVSKKYTVEKKQIYIGGLSMGGMGTFEIVYRNPGLFAAAFPMCGGADVSSAAKLTKTHWWVFHGANDDQVLPEFSQRIVNALQKINADVKYSLYPEANHNCWDSAFAEPGLLSWLFSQHK